MGRFVSFGRILLYSQFVKDTTMQQLMIVGTNWRGGDALIISVVIATNDSMKV